VQAWLASRYHTVNIYMGGSDRGRAQPNLNAGWVSTVVAPQVFPAAKTLLSWHSRLTKAASAPG
jgi:hypothetical protein